MHIVSRDYSHFVSRFAALLLVVASANVVKAQSLIRVGDNCRYYKAYDTRSFAPPGWQLPDFRDTTWEDGATGYVFDDPQLRTRLRPGRHRGYAYVRSKFDLQNPEKIKSLILRVEFERSFVAYLNGVEVARHPKAGTLRGIAPVEVARGFPTSPDGQFDISKFIRVLRKGENVLALEGSFSNEGAMVVPMTPVLLANFIRGPFIQNATTNSVQVIWRTFLAGNTVVNYGLKPDLELHRNAVRPVTDHVLTLTNLVPGQKYFYRVESELPSGMIRSEIESFTTLKSSGALQFIVLGDSGQGTSTQKKIAEVIQRSQPDLVIHCGDLVYQGINDRTVDWRYFNYYQPHMASTPYYMVVGNHDLNCCFGDGESDYNPTNWVLNATNFQNSFFLPTNSATGTKHFYSFDAADVHFAGLYNPWFADYVFKPDSEQFRWLTNDLASSSKPWKFIFMHMPLATSGGHFSRDDNTNALNDASELMSLLLPAAERYGVQLIMGGHDHNFERFVPTNGIHHFVTGGGGGSVYEMKQRHPASAQFWATNHCTRVTVTNDSILVQALDVQGAIFDSFVIQPRLVPDRLFDSSWHAPRIWTDPANDADGNITGQTFDFTGDPILPRSGRWSNLGRVYVNNDNFDLFIGLENPMIYGDSTIYVFVESPREKGVATLAGLGNGVPDPEREGVDGLDFLENLSFTNFNPSIVCIVGDEFGDGELRGYKRPASRFSTGQGIFHLDGSFSSVDGVRLQQFNRSPQTDPVGSPGTELEFAL